MLLWVCDYCESADFSAYIYRGVYKNLKALSNVLV